MAENWKSIDRDGLPVVGERVLITDASWKTPCVEVGFRDHDEDWYESEGVDFSHMRGAEQELFKPSHWMAFPTPPHDWVDDRVVYDWFDEF